MVRRFSWLSTLVLSWLIASMAVSQCVLATGLSDADQLQYLQQIKTLVDQRNFAAALEQIEQPPDGFTHHDKLLLFEVAARHGLQQFAACIKTANRYLSQYPVGEDIDQVYYLKGICHIRLEQHELGRADLLAASQTTRDDALRQVAGELLASTRVGINLGGDAKLTEQEILPALAVALEILRRALLDYHDQHGSYPNQLEQLQTGEYATLRRLPKDPLKHGLQTFSYQRIGQGYRVIIPEKYQSNLPECLYQTDTAPQPLTDRPSLSNNCWILSLQGQTIHDDQ